MTVAAGDQSEGRKCVVLLRSAGVAGLCACLMIGACASRPKSAPIAIPGNSSAFVSSPVDVSRLREEAIAIIEQASRSDDAQLRANAVEAASFSPKRLRAIIDAGLTDRIPGVRTVAASAVGKTQSRDLINKVRPLLADRSNHVRASAILAMSKNGERVDQSPLGQMLMADDSPWVSRQAAYVLGELGNRSALPMLRSAAATRAALLAPNQQRPFQLQVVEAMVKLGETDQLPALRASLYPSVLEEFESAVLGIQILGELRDRESIGQLTSVVQYTDRGGQPYPAEMRLAAAGALARMGIENAAQVADEYLSNPNSTVRAQAAAVYGNHPGPKYWDRLKVLLDDQSPSVRVSAAAGILRSGMR